MFTVIFLVAVVLCVVQCQPLNILIVSESLEDNSVHELSKRFINPWLINGGFSNDDLSKIRSKRSYEEECEKLRLCRLHARSNQNFFAAFELYFVNREHARLWDHHAHSLAECNQLYSCYR